MNMKKILIYSIGLTVLVSSVSCKKRYEEMNMSPNSPETAPSQLLLSNVMLTSAYRIQLTGGMNSCDQWVQHTKATTYMDEDWYSPRSGNVVNPIWANLYNVSFEDCMIAIKSANEANQKNNEAIGYILKAYIGYNLTMLYGDVPYADACQAEKGGDFITPKYDPQSAVFNSLVSDLDKAISLIGSTTQSTGLEELETYDYVYGGAMQKWKKLANGLKIRVYLALTTGGIDKTSEINTLLSSADVFQSSGDDAKLSYLAGTSAGNPVFQWNTSARLNDFRMSSTLVNYMMGSSTDSTKPADARLEIYADPCASGKNAGKYVGGKNGVKGMIKDNSPMGSKFYNATSPFYFMSYTELLFIKAEMNPNAANYNAAVTASFLQNGLLATDATAALADPKFAYDGSKGAEMIATQKWVSFFGQGVEAFNNWRRTGFPLFTPATSASTNGGVLPRRIPYHSDEKVLNAAHVTSAVGTLSPGVDVVTSRVWFDRNHPLDFGNK